MSIARTSASSARTWASAPPNWPSPITAMCFRAAIPTLLHVIGLRQQYHLHQLPDEYPAVGVPYRSPLRSQHPGGEYQGPQTPNKHGGNDPQLRWPGEVRCHPGGQTNRAKGRYLLKRQIHDPGALHALEAHEQEYAQEVPTHRQVDQERGPPHNRRLYRSIEQHHLVSAAHGGQHFTHPNYRRCSLDASRTRPRRATDKPVSYTHLTLPTNREV